MKRSLYGLLIMVSLVVAAASMASADGGHIFAGVDFYSTDSAIETVVMVDHPVGDNMAIAAVYWPSDKAYAIRARFGQERGFYAAASFWDGSMGSWQVGGYFEGAVTSQLSYRANVGIYSEGSETYPDASVDYEYELSDALAIMGKITFGLARVGLGYHF